VSEGFGERSARADYTIVGGQVRYERAATP
jgi:hypothetical protein